MKRGWFRDKTMDYLWISTKDKNYTLMSYWATCSCLARDTDVRLPPVPELHNKTTVLSSFGIRGYKLLLYTWVMKEIDHHCVSLLSEWTRTLLLYWPNQPFVWPSKMDLLLKTCVHCLNKSIFRQSKRVLFIFLYTCISI